MKNEKSISYFEKSIDSATSLYNKGLFDESKTIFDSIESLINSKTDIKLQIKFLFNKSELLKKQGEYEICLQNYFKTLELSKLSNDTMRVGLSHYNIASTYYLLKDYKHAEIQIYKALTIFSKINQHKREGDCYVVLSSIYRIKSDLQQAKKYLIKAIDIYKKTEEGQKNSSIGLNNYGNILLEEKKTDEAILAYNEAAKISREQNDLSSLSIRLGNIAEAYLEKKDLIQAKKYVDSSQNIAIKLNAKETIILNKERLITFYKLQNNFSKALETSQELRNFEAKINQDETENLIKDIEDKYETKIELSASKNKIELLKKEKLVTQKKNENSLLILFTLIILSTTTFYLLFYKYQKQKKLRHMDQELHNREKEILLTKNKIEKIEKHQLEKEIEYKRNELVSFSLNLTEKTNHINELNSAINQLKFEESVNKKSIDKVKGILSKMNNDSSSQLYLQIEKINSSFYFKLKSIYPKLTDDDLRLASLVVLGLSTKEIADLFHIEAKSIDMKRYRLKKKLNLDSNLDLRDFLSKI